MEKVIRDGKVAILYSPGLGAGWYSWNTDHKELIFHPKLVELVEAGREKEIDEEFVKDLLGIEHIYTGGARDLEIIWLDEGTAFTISEYDGSESVEIIDDLTIVA